MSELDDITLYYVTEKKSLSSNEACEIAILENDRGLTTIDEYTDYLRPMTLCVTMAAGAGTRWVSSLQNAQNQGLYASFPLDFPRALFPVQNGLSPLSSSSIAVGAYALKAFQNLGDNLLIIRSHKQEICKDILTPLGISAQDVEFFYQEPKEGIPLGHGDALYQARDIISKYEYIMINFAGDLTSYDSALSSLMVMDALDSRDNDVRGIIPCVYSENPSYGIDLDSEGYPIKFAHQKLTGSNNQVQSAYENVGLRLYKTDALLDALEYFHKTAFSEKNGYSIQGNSTNECALDNIDSFLSEKKVLRLLPVATMYENVHLKKLSDLEKFEDAISMMTAKKN